MNLFGSRKKQSTGRRNTQNPPNQPFGYNENINKNKAPIDKSYIVTEENKIFKRKVKVIFLGDSGTGKSSLFYKLKTSMQAIPYMDPTTGPDLTRKEILRNGITYSVDV